MSKIFIKTIAQYGAGDELDSKITALNEFSKAINGKIKKYEKIYDIEITLDPLPTNNFDCSPTSVPIETMAIIDGPIKGVIPIYTNVDIELPTPKIVPTVTPVALSPYGPVLGVPGVGIDPFGSSSDSFDDKLKLAKSYVKILQKICSQLNGVIDGVIDLYDVDKKHFKFNKSTKAEIMASLVSSGGIEYDDIRFDEDEEDEDDDGSIASTEPDDDGSIASTELSDIAKAVPPTARRIPPAPPTARRIPPASSTTALPESTTAATSTATARRTTAPPTARKIPPASSTTSLPESATAATGAEVPKTTTTISYGTKGDTKIPFSRVPESTPSKPEIDDLKKKLEELAEETRILTGKNQ